MEQFKISICALRLQKPVSRLPKLYLVGMIFFDKFFFFFFFWWIPRNNRENCSPCWITSRMTRPRRSVCQWNSDLAIHLNWTYYVHSNEVSRKNLFRPLYVFGRQVLDIWILPSDSYLITLELMFWCLLVEAPWAINIKYLYHIFTSHIKLIMPKAF